MRSSTGGEIERPVHSHAMARDRDHDECWREFRVYRRIGNHSWRHLLRPERLTAHPRHSEQQHENNSGRHGFFARSAGVWIGTAHATMTGAPSGLILRSVLTGNSEIELALNFDEVHSSDRFASQRAPAGSRPPEQPR